MKEMRFSSLPGDFAKKNQKSKIVYHSSSRPSADSSAKSSDQYQDHQDQHDRIESSDQQQNHQDQHDRIEDEQDHGCWAHEAHDDVCGASACEALESFGTGLRSEFKVFKRWCVGVEIPASGIGGYSAKSARSDARR